MLGRTHSFMLLVLLVVATSPALGEPQGPLESEPDPLFDDEFEFDDETGFPDPLEESNRKILKFNQGLDRVLIGPLTQTYAFIFPDPVRLSIRRLFENLNTPVVLANDVLQLEWKDAAVTTSAFVVNSTAGLGGFFEPGEKIGLARHHSDFGQTLALAEVPSGPYLMIPIAGPSNARDATGAVVDVLLRPLTWVFGIGSVALLYGGGQGMVLLDQHRDKLKELEKSSVDFYPVLRSAYYQSRSDRIWGRRQERRPEGFD